MSWIIDRLVAVNKIQLDALLEVIRVGGDMADRMACLNLEAAKALFAEGTASVRGLAAGTGSPTGASLWSAGLASWEKAAGYAHNLHAIFVDTGAGGSEVLERKLRDAAQGWLDVADMAARNAPVGYPQAGFSAAKSSMIAAESFLEGFLKVAKIAAGYAEETVPRAATAAEAKQSSEVRKG